MKDLVKLKENTDVETKSKVYKKLDDFMIKLILEDGFTLVPVYFDDAFEGRRTYRADLIFLPSSKEDKDQAKEKQNEGNKLEIN